MGFTIRQTVPSENDLVLEFLVNYYLKYEPSFINIGIPNPETNVLFIKLLKKEIDRGMSLVVENTSNGAWAGAILNLSNKMLDAIEKEKKSAMNLRPGKTRDLIEFWAYTQQQAFEKHQLKDRSAENFFCISQGAVAPKYRSLGLASSLIYTSLELGFHLGYNACLIETTNA